MFNIKKIIDKGFMPENEREKIIFNAYNRFKSGEIDLHEYNYILDVNWIKYE